MLAIAGGKGGCGKTTTTLGLATALSRAPASSIVDPLAVDVDWDMPNLHVLAGADREPTLTEVRDSDASPPIVDGFQLLPAPRDPPRDHDAATTLLRTVNAAVDAERPVLLDCPAGAGPDAAVPLRVADAALLVAAPRSASLRNAAKTGAMARRLGTPVRGIVLTHVVDADLTPTRRDAIESLLGGPVVGIVPEETPPVLDCPAVRRAYAAAVRRLSHDGRIAVSKSTF